MEPNTVINIDEFAFYNGEKYDESLSPDPSGNTSSQYGKFPTKHVEAGATGKFLESKGFGWLLDVDQDDDNQTPLLEELDIDLTDIYYKVRCVLLPLPYFRMKLDLVRESPDFWGPLLVVVMFALLSIYGQLSVVSWILTIWCIGSFMVYFMARVLGGDVFYSQVLGIVGYCLIPLVCTGLVSSVLARFSLLSTVVSLFGILWSVYSAGALICVEELQQKKPLVLYPVFLLYIYFYSLYSGV